MALVELSIPAHPAHVRTARMVAVALARRAGLPDELVDEVRLAVGEACGLALCVQAATHQAAPLMLRFDDGEAFAVDVHASAVLQSATGEAAVKLVTDAAVAAGWQQLPAGAVVAILSEVAPRFEVVTSDDGMRVTLGWPPVRVS